MSSGKWLAFIFLILINFLALVKSQSHWCLNNGNYTSNSMYKTNLDTLLSSISSSIDGNGFYNASNGENSDRVNAMALCRGDLQLDTCRSCINNATGALLQLCPHQKEAIFWAEGGQCMLRYSNESIFGKLATDPLLAWFTIAESTSPEEFNRDLRTLLDNLRNQAAYGGALKKFAAANATGPDLLTIYGLAQCTPDLNSDDCSDCLIQLVKFIPRCCSGRLGFASHCPSCLLRYETYSFYDDTPQPAPPLSVPIPPLPAPPGKDDNTSRTIIIIVVPIIVGLIVALCIGIFLRFRQNHKPMEKLETHNEISTVESLCYDFDTIRAATDNFSDANMLEQGGCGIVYKGKLQSGQQIAVKRLSMISGLGDLEFKNEVLLVARLQHKNLVRLLGFSSEGSERFLIHEFVENGSLDHFLFDPINRPNVDWDRRYKIIRGVARGILYLQEDSRLKIIHCGLKASNILLDGEINPKISDFGMTRRYMASEHAFHRHFSSKSSIFSFGILVLEIVSGKKTNSFRNGENVEALLSFAWKNWHEGTAENVIDHALMSSPRSLHDIMRCIHIGLLCVQEDATHRLTMASIVLMLTNFSITLPTPSQPAFFMSTSFDPEISLLR